MWDLGSRGLGFRVLDLGFLGCRDQGLGSKLLKGGLYWGSFRELVKGLSRGILGV